MPAGSSTAAVAASPLDATQRPIFIVGPGRSGSTLLRSLLSAHSRIAITPETHFMGIAELGGMRRGTAADIESFWREYTGHLRFRDLGIDARRCRELAEVQGKLSFETIFRGLLASYAELASKPRVGEKTPGHSRFLSELLAWFPDGRVIVTCRDPRAVVASQLKTAYVRRRLTPRSVRGGTFTGKRGREIDWYADNWATVFEQRLAPWRRDPRFHVVAYEALVTDPEPELRALCQFLDEDYEPDMLTQRASATVHQTAFGCNAQLMDRWVAEHHAKASSPISAASLNKWRQELTAGEIAAIEARCAQAMRAAGYQPVVTAGRRVAARLGNATLGHAAWAESRARQLAEGRLKEAVARMASRGVDLGLPPAWVGYRWIRREGVKEFLARRPDVRAELVHSPAVAQHSLPCNVGNAEELPADRGWWGYSFRDVPTRAGGETMIVTMPDALVVWCRDARDQFHPALVTDDRRALDLREMRFRPGHGEVLRAAGRFVRRDRATWVLERVYSNHSHWLTAHLPKLILLRERGMLGDVLLPLEITPAMVGSLHMLGIDPAQHQRFDPDLPLRVRELTILVTDRFRPELLRSVPMAFGIPQRPMAGGRKVFISRASAARRRLQNEDEVWALLQPAGFERVKLEELGFDAQVALMRETAVLCAPHGAGLANMMFCPPGALVVEIADLDFPNPNFYALAAALGHRYAIVSARSLGCEHPLERDLHVEPARIRDLLPAMAEG